MVTQDDAAVRIREELDDVWGSGGREFATFELEDDNELFVQYLDGVLHMAWPFDEDPEDLLEDDDVALPKGAFQLDWGGGDSVQFGVGDALIEDVTAFIAELLAILADTDDVPEFVCRTDADR